MAVGAEIAVAGAAGLLYSSIWKYKEIFIYL
jgi:hypothetical protein